MGNAESAEELTYGSGYQVLKVQDTSPGKEAGLENFFDIIVSAAGVPLDQEDNRLVDILFANVEKSIALIVYSSKTNTFRETYLTPSMTWGGKGLIGVSIRYTHIKDASEYVWHVLDVYPDSPAAAAGLCAHDDYIVGSLEVLFTSSEDFYTLVEAFDGRKLDLLVYNSKSDATRSVSITPSSQWGGSGSLGCDVGYGFLHRIPTRKADHVVSLPPEGATIGSAPPPGSAPAPAAASDAPSAGAPAGAGHPARAEKPASARVLRLSEEAAARSVLVTNVAPTVSMDVLKGFFGASGQVVSVTQLPEGDGSSLSVYIEFAESAAVAAASAFSGVPVGGSAVQVQPIPRERIIAVADATPAAPAAPSAASADAAAPSTSAAAEPLPVSASVPAAAAPAAAPAVVSSASVGAVGPAEEGSGEGGLSALQLRQQQLQERLRKLNVPVSK